MNGSAAAAVAWRLVRLVAALLILNASLTFVSVWPTLSVKPAARLSAEAALAVLGLAILAQARGGVRHHATERVLAFVWVILSLAHYVEVSTRALYGRSVNLYWDLKLLPDVGAMFAYVARPQVVGAFLLALTIVPLLFYVPFRWAFAQVGLVAAAPPGRRALMLLASAVLALGAAQFKSDRLAGRLPFTPPITVAIGREAIEFTGEVMRGARPLPPAPDLESDLAEVRGADVLVLFIESYGAISWERADLVDALAPARAGMEAAIAGTGRGVVSALVESPTFGGESWLAHITLLSGTDVRDQDVNRRLMAERRDTLVTTFTRAGYRALAVMPGLHNAWPEGRFYGFDRIYGAGDLGYEGPPFGWWDVTDQFVLARTDALAIAPQPRPPAFVFLPSISTHAPFTPVPPYQPDWSRLLTPAPYDSEALTRAYDDEADWSNLSPGYARALVYAHETIAGYLRLRSDRDLVLVILGDHQPPALVSGEGASWNVPVHVVASRPALLDRLRVRGFDRGFAPGRTVLTPMDALTRVLLDAFGSDRQ